MNERTNNQTNIEKATRKLIIALVFFVITGDGSATVAELEDAMQQVGNTVRCPLADAAMCLRHIVDNRRITLVPYIKTCLCNLY